MARAAPRRYVAACFFGRGLSLFALTALSRRCHTRSRGCRISLPVKPPFEVIDHTADVGILARGETLAEAFANAAKGMFSLMVELREVAEKEERRVRVEASDLEGLLVAWLSELIFILDVEDLVFGRFEVETMSSTGLAARAFGERLDRERHPRGMVIKAVTRHMLEVGRADHGYQARVIFDI